MLFSPLILVLLVPALIAPSNGELTANLLPQQVQGVCQEETLTFSCLTNGTAMLLYSPPIINAAQALILASSQNFERANTATASILVEDSSSFLGTLTLYISVERSNGTFDVFCNTTNEEGMIAGNMTAYKVLRNPANEMPSALSIVVDQILNDTSVAKVNISWNHLDDVEQYMVNINEEVYRNNKSCITATLPYGKFNATIIAMNRCGKYRQNVTEMITEPQSTPPPMSLRIDFPVCLAFVAVEGLLLLIIAGVAAIYGCYRCYKWLKDK